jgi:hypothetical protein
MQPSVEAYGINCVRFGEITGIDCSCLRDDSCSGCFIYNSCQKMSSLFSSLENKLDNIDSNEIN